MTGVLADVAAVAAVLGAVAWATGRRHVFLVLTAGANAMIAVVCALRHDWAYAAYETAIVAVLLGWDWWDRTGRRAAKALGAKSAALVGRLVERIREAGPATPEGARG